jgi:hypothetical protein
MDRLMSEAEKLRKALAVEEAKPLPDDEVIYAIKQRMPYANTIDTDKLRRGGKKLDDMLKEL